MKSDYYELLHYIGITSNLIKRISQHKVGNTPGFTKKYKVYKLVYYERWQDIKEAIMREKQIKKWNRLWKTELIEKRNPTWKDLYDDLL